MQLSTHLERWLLCSERLSHLQTGSVLSASITSRITVGVRGRKEERGGGRVEEGRGRRREGEGRGRRREGKGGGEG